MKSSGMISLAGSARYLLSPLLAGLLLSVTGISTLLIMDICTFFLTVIVIAVVRSGIPQTKAAAPASFMADLKQGWRAVASNKGIMTLLVIAALMTFCMGAMQILAEPMILSFSDSRTLGIAETVCASGMLVSGLYLGIRGMKKHILAALCLSLGTQGLFMMGFGLTENIVLICITGFAFFAMLPFANAGFDYLVRTNTANEVQGRVWSLVGFISQLGYVAAYGTCGLISDWIARAGGVTVGRGSAAVITLSGGILAVLAVVLYLSKSVKTLEQPAGEEKSSGRN